MTDRQPVTPDDLRTAAALGRAALEPPLDEDWTVLAREMEWTCRQTLDHLPDALGFYAANLATPATGPRPRPRNGDPARSVAELLLVLESAAAVLAVVAEAAPPGTHAFHPAGMADPEGFLAMGCAEILLHTDDIAAALGVPFGPSAALCARVARRIFPWAPIDVPPWDALRWGGGRVALPDRERLDANWWWHCAPLDEWDGAIKRRTVPPAWRWAPSPGNVPTDATGRDGTPPAPPLRAMRCSQSRVPLLHGPSRFRRGMRLAPRRSGADPDPSPARSPLEPGAAPPSEPGAVSIALPAAASSLPSEVMGSWRPEPLRARSVPGGGADWECRWI